MNVPILTNELLVAYKTYLQATEKKEVLKNHLNPMLDKLLLEMKITIADKNVGNGRHQETTKRVIVDQNELYLASDEDMEMFFKASHVLYIQEGFNNVEVNHCPILMARSEEVKAEHIFIDESMYLVEKTNLKREKLNSSLSARKEYIKLTLDLIEKIIIQKQHKI